MTWNIHPAIGIGAEMVGLKDIPVLGERAKLAQMEDAPAVGAARDNQVWIVGGGH